jgi:hypothetical protein
MVAAKKPTSQRKRPARRRGAIGRMLKLLKGGGDLRKRKVRRLRAAVRASRYYNELKLSIAMDRLLADLAGEPLALC